MSYRVTSGGTTMSELTDEPREREIVRRAYETLGKSYPGGWYVGTLYWLLDELAAEVDRLREERETS